MDDSNSSEDQIGVGFICLFILNIIIWIVMSGGIRQLQDAHKAQWYIISLQVPEQVQYKIDLDISKPKLRFNKDDRYIEWLYWRDLKTLKKEQSLYHILNSFNQQEAKMLTVDFYRRDDYKERINRGKYDNYQIKSFYYQITDGEIAEEKFQTTPPNSPKKIRQTKKQFLILAIIFSLLHGGVFLIMRGVETQKITLEQLDKDQNYFKYFLFSSIAILWGGVFYGLLA